MLEHMDRQNERQMKIIERQAGTLDRIVAGRFDRPQIAQERTISMPKQFTPDDLADILSELDDDRFLSRVDEVVQ